MEGWIINAGMALGTIVFSFGGMRYIVMDMKRTEQAILIRLDTHGDSIVKLNTKSESAITMKQVSDEFLRTEMFIQYQKYLDNRLDDIKIDMSTVKKEVGTNTDLARQILIKISSNVKD